MIELTDKQKKELAPWDSYFRTVVYASYMRNLTDREFSRLAEVWEKISGERVNGCMACNKMALLKRIGTIYFTPTVKKVKRTRKTI